MHKKNLDGNCEWLERRIHLDRRWLFQSSWRCLSTTTERHASLRFDWQWCSNRYHVFDHIKSVIDCPSPFHSISSFFSLCLSWISFTGKSWCIDDLWETHHIFFSNVFWFFIGAIVCYVLLGTPAGYTSARLYKCKKKRSGQKLRICLWLFRSIRWWKLEKERSYDSCCLSWVIISLSKFQSVHWILFQSYIRHFFRFKSRSLVEWKFSGYSIYNVYCSSCSMVLCCNTIGIHRGLSRF